MNCREHTRWQPPGITCARVEELMRDAGYAKTVVDQSVIVEHQLWQPSRDRAHVVIPSGMTPNGYT